MPHLEAHLGTRVRLCNHTRVASQQEMSPIEQCRPKPRPWAQALPHEQVLGSPLRNTSQRTAQLPVPTHTPPQSGTHKRWLPLFCYVIINLTSCAKKGKRVSAYERRKTPAPGSAPLGSPATAQQTVRRRQQRNAEPDYQMTLELGKHQSCRACAIRAVSPTHVHDKGRPH